LAVDFTISWNTLLSLLFFNQHTVNVYDAYLMIIMMRVFNFLEEVTGCGMVTV